MYLIALLPSSCSKTPPACPPDLPAYAGAAAHVWMATPPSSSSPLTTLPSHDDPSALAGVELVNEAGPSTLPSASIEELKDPTTVEATAADVRPDSFFAPNKDESSSLADTSTAAAASQTSPPRQEEEDAGNVPLPVAPPSSIPAEEAPRPAASPHPPSPLPLLDASGPQTSSSDQQIGQPTSTSVKPPLPPDAEPPQEPQPIHAELSEGTDAATSVGRPQGTALQSSEADPAKQSSAMTLPDRTEEEEGISVPEEGQSTSAADPMLESEAMQTSTAEPGTELPEAVMQATSTAQSNGEAAPVLIPAVEASELAADVAGGSGGVQVGETVAEGGSSRELGSSADSEQGLPTHPEPTLEPQEVSQPAWHANGPGAVEVEQATSSQAAEASVIGTDAERQIDQPSTSAAEAAANAQSNATEDVSGGSAAIADAMETEPVASSQPLHELGEGSKASVTAEPMINADPAEDTAPVASQAAITEVAAADSAVSENGPAATLSPTVSGTSDGVAKPSEAVEAASAKGSSQTETKSAAESGSTGPTKSAPEAPSAAAPEETSAPSDNKLPSKEEARVSLVLSVNQELIRLCVDLQDKSASGSAPPEMMLRDISHRLQTNLAFLASMADKGRKANAEAVNLSIPRLDMFPHASYRSDLEKLSPTSTLPKLYTQMAQAFAGLTRPVAPGFGGGPPSTGAGSTANTPAPERKHSRDESTESARKKPALPNGHGLPRSSASPAPNANVGFANPFANGTPPLATPPIRGSPGSVGSVSHPQSIAVATPARQSTAEQPNAVSPSNQLPPGMSPQQAQVLMQAFGPTALSTFSFLQSYLRSPQCKPQFAALPLAVQMQQIAGLAAQQKQRLAMAASQQQQQQHHHQQQQPNSQLHDSSVGQQQMQHNAPGSTPLGDTRRQAPFHASSASPSLGNTRASPGGGFMPPPPHPQSMGMPNGLGHHPGQAQAQAQRQASADLGRSSPASIGRGGGGGGGTNASSPASMLRQSFGAGGAQTPPPPATGHTHVFNPFAATGHTDGQGAGGHGGGMAGSMLPPNGGMNYNGGAGGAAGPNLNTNAAMMMAMAQQQHQQHNQQQSMPGFPAGMNPQAFLAQQQQQQQGRQAPPGQNGQGSGEGLSTYQQLAQILSQSQQHQQAAMNQQHALGAATSMGPPAGNTPGGAGGYAALNGGSAGANAGMGMGMNGSSSSAGFDSLPPHMQQFLAQQQQMQQHNAAAAANGNGSMGGGLNNWSGGNANPAALMQGQENQQGYYPNGASFDPSSMLSGGGQQQQQQYGRPGSSGMDGTGGGGGINPQALSGAMRGGQAWSQQTLWGDGGAARPGTGGGAGGG